MKTNKTLEAMEKAALEAMGATPVEEVYKNEAPPTQHSLTGTEAEDIRSLNRSLNNIRMYISAQVITEDAYTKQYKAVNDKIIEANTKKEELLVDFTKKAAELQKVVDTAFNRLKLNSADKWQFDPEACIFHKGA